LTDLPLRVDLRRWLPLVAAGLPFGISSFAVIVSFKFDTVFLSLARTSSEVGWYSAAYSLVFVLLNGLLAFNGVLVPSLSRQYGFDPDGVSRFYQKAIRLLWSATLPIAVGTSVLADQLVVALYGSTFTPAGIALRILIWVLPTMTLTSICGAMTTVLHRERATARLNLVNATFNVSLNLWAIPHYGILGAAVATVATELVGLVQFAFLLRDVSPLRLMLPTLHSTVLSSVVMLVAILTVGHLYLPVIVTIGAFVYLLSLILSGGLTMADVRGVVPARFHSS
jgi:O-antigen/teichoic acid export membrane protein